MTEKTEFRESKDLNAVFFVCSLIEYIGRKTKNSGKDVCNKLGVENIKKILDFADIYHCENIDDVADEFIEKACIQKGNFDTVAKCRYSIPSFWDIGKIYKKVIKLMCDAEKISFLDAIFNTYNSFISEKIDDYNSAFYYDWPENIYLCYVENRVA